MKFIVYGHGRKVGAIGISYGFAASVEAKDVEDAKIRIYDTYEHIHNMHVVPVPEEKT
jgi:hypothetical protein